MYISGGCVCKNRPMFLGLKPFPIFLLVAKPTKYIMKPHSELLDNYFFLEIFDSVISRRNVNFDTSVNVILTLLHWSIPQPAGNVCLFFHIILKFPFLALCNSHNRVQNVFPLLCYTNPLSDYILLLGRRCKNKLHILQYLASISVDVTPPQWKCACHAPGCIFYFNCRIRSRLKKLAMEIWELSK